MWSPDSSPALSFAVTSGSVAQQGHLSVAPEQLGQGYQGGSGGVCSLSGESSKEANSATQLAVLSDRSN